MPFTQAERVQRYRKHAVKVREIAKLDSVSTKVSGMLEGMAREWEQMADSAERQYMASIPAKPNGAGKHTP